MDSHFTGRVLIVDDDASVGAYYQNVLTRAGFQVALAHNLHDMQERLASVTHDIVLLDLNLGTEHGLDGLAMILRDAPFTRVFVLTAHGTVPKAVEALRRGATGFFEKGADPQQLIAELSARAVPPTHGESAMADVGLIGRSPALVELVERIERLRDVDSTVLLLGESGTGKEVVARAIHRTSSRNGQRFDAINCGAIPEMLLESELFGHKRGAFTDAKSDRKGIFELAKDGTLLLDEIGDMPLSLQRKLLRVLQEREITPVGSATTLKVNTRVIAATHRDILAEARAKRFREDLYYRLSIVVLRIPPLRQRREDIPLLVDHFLSMFNRRFNRDVHAPSEAVMSRLMAYDWPGNVRELQNALERAVVLSTDGRISVDHAFAHLAPGKALEFGNDSGLQSGIDQTFFDLPLSEAKQAFERCYLEYQLKQCHGNVVNVAARSGRYRADVYRLLNRYHIDHAEYRT